MEELLIDASIDNLYQVLDFMDGILDANDCDPVIKAAMDIAVEEIFVNIAHYAYNPDIGEAKVRCGVAGDPPAVTVELSDSGTAFDPLAKPDPDITKPLSERPIGGLGIYMVKKSMDSVTYRREGGRNILTMVRRIRDDGREA